jgi:hypothetical protein
VAEPVVVFDTDVELVMVLDDNNVTEVRGVTDQQAEFVMLSVIDTDPQSLPVEVGSPVVVAWPVPTADELQAELAEGVAVSMRVARAVAVADPDTVAVLGAATEFVPVFELVVVFDTLMLRVCVGDPVELRDCAKLQVRFAEVLAVFVPGAERVVVFDPTELALTVGVEVPVRDPF